MDRRRFTKSALSATALAAIEMGTHRITEYILSNDQGRSIGVYVVSPSGPGFDEQIKKSLSSTLESIATRNGDSVERTGLDWYVDCAYAGGCDIDMPGSGRHKINGIVSSYFETDEVLVVEVMSAPTASTRISGNTHWFSDTSSSDQFRHYTLSGLEEHIPLGTWKGQYVRTLVASPELVEFVHANL